MRCFRGYWRALFSHALSGQIDAIGVVNEAIQDGIGRPRGTPSDQASRPASSCLCRADWVHNARYQGDEGKKIVRYAFIRHPRAGEDIFVTGRQRYCGELLMLGGNRIAAGADSDLDDARDRPNDGGPRGVSACAFMPARPMP